METEVDRLLNLLKGRGKTDVSKLAKDLKTSESTIQEWVDFLVEENIVGIEYNFTKPYVYLIEQQKEIDMTKEEFQKYKQAFKDNASTSTTNSTPEYAWKQHVIEKLEFMKHFFYSEAEKRQLKNIDKLWEEYKTKATEL